MSFIAFGIGAAALGGSAFLGYEGSGSKPNYDNVQSPYQQIHQRVPGLPTMTGTAASNIQDELSGNLPSDVIGNIRNAGAAWGVSSGMPGSDASLDVTLKDLGISSLQMQQQGMGNYLNFLSGVGGLMMPIDQQMTVADAKAAPDPKMEYLSSILGGIGGGLMGGMGGVGGSGVGGGGGSVDSGPYANWSNPGSISVPPDGTSSFGPSSYGTAGPELTNFLYGGVGGSSGILTQPLYGGQQDDNYF